MFSIHFLNIFIILSSIRYKLIESQYMNPLLVSKLAANYCLSDNEVMIENAWYQKSDYFKKNIFTRFKDNKRPCYSNTTGVTNEDFPIISHEFDSNEDYLKYPKCYLNVVSDLIHYTEYQFNDTTGTYWKSGKLMGFNNVWLGCPQELCFSGSIDAIYRTHGGKKFILRGRHNYSLDNPSNYIEVVAIEHYINQTDGYYDTSFTNSDGLVLIVKNWSIWWSYKGSQFQPNNNIGISAKSVFNVNFPTNVETVFYQRIGSKERIYYFKNGYYWMARYSDKTIKGTQITRITTTDGPKSVKVLNVNFPQKVNAIDIDVEEGIEMFYVYSGWTYFKVKVNNKWFHEAFINVSMTSEWVFRDRFKCKDDVYQRFGGYEKYIENHAKYSEIQTIKTEKSTFKTTLSQSLETTKQTNVENSDSDSNILVVFLIIVFVVIVIISIIAVLLFIIKNKLKNKRQESSRKQITGIDPRFGSIDSKTNITINVSEISIASNASNSSRISGFFEPTGAHIRKTIPVKDQQK